jgi:sterol desaturase/sphingolipid hydroxylase (fatty acid hydroxylase superfamily)
MDWIRTFYDGFWGPHLTLAPGYLIFFVLLAWAVYLYRRETGGFFKWLLPKDIWTHRSTRIDFALFIIGRLMSIFGIIARFGGTPAVATYVASIMPQSAFGAEARSPVVLALLFWVSSEFAYYWAHRAHHAIKTIWPLHAVHHSAAVLTPVTTYRQHPLAILVNTAFQSVVIGAILGVLVGALDSTASYAEIAGVNAFIVLSNATVANFHHSHIWISFGPVFERFFISPAQHQVHHSTDPKHYNKNFGNTLAVWDWAFGTLYVAASNETIALGLNEKAEAPLMTHRLVPVLWDPMRRLFGRSAR